MPERLLDRLRGVLFRMKAVLRPDAAWRDLDEELRFHVQMEAERLRREGVPPREARRRAMVELNVDDGGLDAVLDVLPSMRRPTISRLAGEGGWAIRAAVPRDALPTVVAALRSRGGTDVVVSRAEQILS